MDEEQLRGKSNDEAADDIAIEGAAIVDQYEREQMNRRAAIVSPVFSFCCCETDALSLRRWNLSKTSTKVLKHG